MKKLQRALSVFVMMLTACLTLPSMAQAAEKTKSIAIVLHSVRRNLIMYRDLSTCSWRMVGKKKTDRCGFLVTCIPYSICDRGRYGNCLGRAFGSHYW